MLEVLCFYSSLFTITAITVAKYLTVLLKLQLVYPQTKIRDKRGWEDYCLIRFHWLAALMMMHLSLYLPLMPILNATGTKCQRGKSKSGKSWGPEPKGFLLVNPRCSCYLSQLPLFSLMSSMHPLLMSKQSKYLFTL